MSSPTRNDPTGRDAATAPRFATTRTKAVAGTPAAPRNGFATPIVTIFGAGIAGLSAAHELIERGFRVRVVEPAASEDREYECEVGGLARNQFGRAALYAAQLVDSLGSEAIAAEPDARDARTADGRARRHLHTWLSLLDDQPATRATAAAKAASARARAAKLGMMRAGTRHPFPERFAFAHPEHEDADAAPVAAKDLYDADNAAKLAVVVERLGAAYAASRDEIVRTLRAIGGDDAVARFRPEENPEHARLVLEVEVVAYTDAKQDEGRSYDVTAQVASRLRDDIVAADQKRATPIPLLADLLRVSGLGAAPLSGVKQPTYLRPSAIWAELRVAERLLPGEHGYRYFPSFYRNLFDVMRRTPIIDDDGRVTAETAFSQLVPAPVVGFAFRGGVDADGRPTPGRIKQFERRRAASLTELRKELELTFQDMQVTERDLLFYELQLTRYATSCTARRRGYESVSWWDFLRGRYDARQPPIRDGDALDPRNAIYSERMAHWLREIPQALIAMQSEETDARTYGTIVAQLLQGDLGSGATSDMTLNGPTSVVWLRQWKRFLKRQGVDFYVGTLTGLELDKKGALLPVVDGPEGDRPRLEPLDPTTGITTAEWLARRSPGAKRPFDDSDFFILAVPVNVAARLVREHAARTRAASRDTGLRGDLARLGYLVEVAGIESPAGVKRDYFTGRPTAPRYPLRDFAGVQYFFPRRIGIGDGHIYYADAEWGLSSISQLAYWRDRGGPRGAFLGQISVDIGDWYAPRELANGERLSAFRCGPEQIAQGTWAQLVECLRKHEAQRIPAPAFFHLDQAIGFDDDRCTNATPFLISVPDQWRLRPGLYGPVREALGEDPRVIDQLEELYDDAGADGFRPRRSWRRGKHEIRYRIANERWVLAGTYVATYTRLTTMEAANESGRHAVNAILRALESEPVHEDRPPRYNGAGQDLGDRCTIANPEDNEWPDLDSLRRLDAALLAEGLPHFLDILRVPEMLAQVPHRIADVASPSRGLSRLMSLASEVAGHEARPLTEGLESLAGQVEQRLRALFEKLAANL